MHTQYLDYTDGDVTCHAYVAHEDTRGARRPCVLISHSWAGQSDAERAKAEEFARMGYVGIAIDVYGKGIRGSHTTDNSALMAPFMADRAMLRRRMLAAVEAARAHPMVDPGRIAAIGFCFGGLCVLDLARSGTSDVKGVVSIHGLFGPPRLGAQAPIAAKVLLLHGWDDPMAPPQDVLSISQELTAARADWQLHAYGHAMHAFTHAQAAAPERGLLYNADAARRAWTATRNFLEEVFA
ncbi:dienelactone hydrolase family protein [Archangium violaceum]|uniref:dienelactone hydrolase family protein n=1 Tax=Archangium violaceum TaxID=83451 RepID=UPI0036DF69E5